MKNKFFFLNHPVSLLNLGYCSDFCIGILNVLKIYFNFEYDSDYYQHRKTMGIFYLCNFQIEFLISDHCSAKDEIAENAIITHIIVAMRVQEIWTIRRRVP